MNIIRKVYDRLFRKKTRRTIWGQKFDGGVVLTTHPNAVNKKMEDYPFIAKFAMNPQFLQIAAAQGMNWI